MVFCAVQQQRQGVRQQLEMKAGASWSQSSMQCNNIIRHTTDSARANVCHLCLGVCLGIPYFFFMQSSFLHAPRDSKPGFNGS